MKTSFKTLFVGLTLVGAILNGCKEDDPQPDNYPNTDNLELVGTAYTDVGGIQVKLWAEGLVEAQYTRFFVELRDSATNALLEDAHVELAPMMDMGMMQHSAPFENPTSVLAVGGLFPCAVVFQMPGDMGWTLDVHVHNHANDAEGEASFTLSVANPSPTRTMVVTPENGGDPLVISYVQPTSPVVGINDFEITLHSKASMMSFPSVDTYTVTIEPEMPSMGHGSPNNVNPTFTSRGHYVGKVNFTMTGLWRINLTIMNGAEVVYSTASFDVTL
ncbi:MAG: FixH family protein [Flavobacteriales bacterium]|nr:FixH family protein [Flavobacteriales bacterium]